MRAEYGIDLRAHRDRWDDLADLVAWLPPGSPLWASIGGPASVPMDVEMMRWIDYRLKVLAWQPTSDGRAGRNQPAPPKKLKYANEREQESRAQNAKASAWERRQALRRGQPTK